MMLKLNILNMINFLKTVNDGSGPVGPGLPGRKTRGYEQTGKPAGTAFKNYKDNRLQPKMWIDVAEPADYLKIVCYYAGDC